MDKLEEKWQETAKTMAGNGISTSDIRSHEVAWWCGALACVEINNSGITISRKAILEKIKSI